MELNEKLVLYLVLAAVVSTVVSHFVKRELDKRYPNPNPQPQSLKRGPVWDSRSQVWK